MLDDQRPPLPPHSEPRKDRPLTKLYEERAKALIRAAMREKGVTVSELAQRLRSMGVEISDGGMANKISRGGFSAAFMLQCVDALGGDISAH